MLWTAPATGIEVPATDSKRTWRCFGVGLGSVSIVAAKTSRTLSRLLLLAIIRRPLQSRFRLAVPLVFGLRDRGGAVRQHVASEQTLAALEPLCIGILGPARPVAVRAGVALCSGLAHV